MARSHKAGWILVVLLAAFNAQGASPVGSDYNVMVAPSFGGVFSDVIRFAAEEAAEGSFQVDGLGTGSWTAADYWFFDTFEAQAQDTASYLVNFEGYLFFRDNRWLIAVGATPDNSTTYWIFGRKASSPPTNNGPTTNWTTVPEEPKSSPAKARR